MAFYDFTSKSPMEDRYYSERIPVELTYGDLVHLRIGFATYIDRYRDKADPEWVRTMEDLVGRLYKAVNEPYGDIDPPSEAAFVPAVKSSRYWPVVLPCPD